MEFSRQCADRWGVLLLAHGAPDKLEDIPEFLLNVRGGRKLPDAAVKEIIHRYSLIGGGSPLLRLTNRQADALAKRLSGADRVPRVYVGMRNWKPYILDAVRRMNEDGVGHVVAICLAPQNSRTSVGLYRKHLLDAAAQAAPHLQTEFVASWHDHPELITALCERVIQALRRAEVESGEKVPVIFTAHSVPERTIAEGDPYEQQVKETAALIARTMGAAQLPEWTVAFQSQGMTDEPWIGPTVESQIDRLAQAGHRHLLIAPVGFVSDHVEVLYDIDVVFRTYGESQGVKVTRSESLNDSPLFIHALASVALSAMKKVASAPSAL